MSTLVHVGVQVVHWCCNSLLPIYMKKKEITNCISSLEQPRIIQCWEERKQTRQRVTPILTAAINPLIHVPNCLVVPYKLLSHVAVKGVSRESWLYVEIKKGEKRVREREWNRNLPFDSLIVIQLCFWQVNWLEIKRWTEGPRWKVSSIA